MANWVLLTQYLNSLSFNIGQRTTLTMNDIRQITLSRAKLHYPVEWSRSMRKGVPYEYIANAGFDVTKIELVYDQILKHYIVSSIELEKII